MLSPSRTLQPAVAHVITNKTNRIAGPHHRPHWVIMILLLLLWPGTILTEGLAKELPTTPVQVAAQSDGSAVASVNLSDPTKFPFSSTGKWTGYLDFLGKPGTKRSIGQPDLFLPVLQDKNDMTFFNLRGQLQFDNTDVSEYNIGLGHRHMFQEWILGGYGYYDQRHTQLGNSYNQFTGGFEAMSVDWGARINGYLPENQTETSTSAATTAQVIRPGDQIKVQVDGLVQEKALPGVDGEVGYLLPIPWRAYTAVFDETRVYAGGYHFFGENQFQSVTGPRGRVEWRAYDLPVLGPGSRFMMGVEAQWDEPRGSQAFGLASLRIPFDVFADKSKRKALTGLDRRMLQPVIRDVDVVTSEVDVTEVVPALNPAGKAYTKAIDVTLDDLANAVADHPDEVIAIFVDGEGIESLDLSTDSRFVLPGNNQTMSIMGKELVVGYETEQYGSGTVGYTPAGTPFTIMNSGATYVFNFNTPTGEMRHLNGFMLDGTGTTRDLMYLNGAHGDVYLTNMLIQNAAHAGVAAYGGGTLYISDSRFENNGTDLGTDATRPLLGHSNTAGLDLWGSVKASVTRSVFTGTTGRAIRVGGSSTLELSDSEVYDNITNGVSVVTNGKAFITRTKIYNNGGLFPEELYGHGMEIQENAYVELTDSEIFGNYESNMEMHVNSEAIITNTKIYGSRTGDGLDVNSFASLTLLDSEVFNNFRDNIKLGGNSTANILNTKIYGSQTGNGIGVYNAASLTLSGSEIYDNAQWGIQDGSSSTLQVETTLFYDHISGSYCTNGTGTFEVDGDPVNTPC